MKPLLLILALLFLNLFATLAQADHIAVVFLSVDKSAADVKASVMAGKRNLVTFALSAGNVTSRQVTVPGELPLYVKVITFPQKNIFYSKSCYNEQTIIELKFPEDFSSKRSKC